MATTLYYAPGACSLAPHIVLEWIGAPYQAVRVGFGSAELLAVNPAGAVPTLRDDDGWLLTQAGAVLDFPMLRWGIRMLPGGMGPWPNVQALHDRLAADPQVQKVLAEESGR